MFDKYGLTTPKEGEIGRHRKNKNRKNHCSHPIALGAHLDHLLWCSASKMNQQSVVSGRRGRTSHRRDVLFILIRTSGLVDVHSILVLPPRIRRGTLARVLLLPQTLCDLLEHHVQRFLVLGVLPHFDGVVLCERYELRV